MDQGLAAWIVFERYLREREKEWDRKAFSQDEQPPRKQPVLQSSRHTLGKILLVSMREHEKAPANKTPEKDLIKS